jgi:cyclopropane-fatty-acyl-phospholipid synthase
MSVFTTTDGQSDLPRYFAQIFQKVSQLPRGRLDIVLGDGRIFRVDAPGAGPVATVEVRNPQVFTRLVRDGHLGFCEAYLDGWWTTPDLQAFMDLVHVDTGVMMDGFLGARVVQAYEKLRHWLRSNTRAQARKNISYHYDLGNDFYVKWLDETMTYSSALFKTGQESLEAAQTAKYASLVEQMGVQRGDHVLEIGCGWGGFAEYAAREHGIRVTGLTISQEQYDFAVERIRKAGLQDMVNFKLQDYRDESGAYDGIASIEMFEAVGEKYWPAYFNALRKNLKPGKLAALQIILIEDSRFEGYRQQVDFIQKFIFPGGMLPSPSALRREIEKAGLNVLRSIEFGESYSLTLRRWRERFNDQWDKISGIGFDDRFYRMWNFYLTSCASSFQCGACDVTQITVRAPAR